MAAEHDNDAQRRPLWGFWEEHSDFERVAMLGIVLGIAVRLLLAGASNGSNDIATWNDFANRVISYGLVDTYRSMPLFNHPPLMGWYAAICQLFALGTGLRFSLCFKSAVLAADLLAMWLIARHWSETHGRTQGLAAAAVYSLNPVSILITAYHGNTDTLCAVLGLCGALLANRGRWARAGLALGAAINVKLIGIFWVPGLLLLCTSWRRAWRFLALLTVAGIPFLIPLIGCFDAFVRNALQYNSLLDAWGVNALAFVFPNAWPELTRALLTEYRAAGRYVVLGVVTVAAVFGRLKAWRPTTTASIAMALFLILTPGFGIQYLVWVVPVLAAASLFWSAAWALTAGSLALWLYVSFITRASPLETEHFRMPRDIGLWGMTAWTTLIAYVAVTTWTSLRPEHGFAAGGRHARRLAAALHVVADTLRRSRRRWFAVAVALTGLVIVSVTGYTWLYWQRDLARDAPWTASSALMPACTSPQKRCVGSQFFFFHTKQEASPWLQLDLGEPRAISEVYVVNRNDCCRGRALPLVVELGGGGPWREVARRDSRFSSWRASFPTHTARYVRLRVDGKAMLHLQDVKVFSPSGL